MTKDHEASGSEYDVSHLLDGSSPSLSSAAYTMAKYGMSMCVLGMAEEFRGSIAVNALWPKTGKWVIVQETEFGCCNLKAHRCRR